MKRLLRVLEVLVVALALMTLVQAQSGRVQILERWNDTNWSRVIVKLKDGSETSYQRHQLGGLYYDYGQAAAPPPPPPARTPAGMDGIWNGNFNDTPVGLQLRRSGEGWTGTIWHIQGADDKNMPLPGNSYAVTNIRLDKATGRLRFEVPAWKQMYGGTMSGNRMSGTFSWEGAGPYPWRAVKGFETVP